MYEYRPGIPAVFYRFPDGSTGVKQGEGIPLTVPKTAAPISHAQWDADRLARLAAKEAARQAAEEAREAAAEAAYEEMKALGVSDETARMMSGHTRN